MIGFLLFVLWYIIGFSIILYEFRKLDDVRVMDLVLCLLAAMLGPFTVFFTIVRVIDNWDKIFFRKLK